MGREAVCGAWTEHARREERMRTREPRLTTITSADERIGSAGRCTRCNDRGRQPSSWRQSREQGIR